MNSHIIDKIKQIADDIPYKIVLSKRRKGSSTDYTKLNILRKNDYYQVECYTETQVFDRKISFDELCDFCIVEVENHYMQLNAWSNTWEYQLIISKKGIPSFKRKSINRDLATNAQETHNRQKKYILEEGDVILPLIDMGIFSANGKILSDKYDKYKQINRFLEIIDDSLRNYNYETEKPLKVIDFGCGKSYLTFVLYYFLTEIKKCNVNMIGLDLKEDVIHKCNLAAKKYGYSNLVFQVGDIGCYKDSTPADMVITLHACDTATDYALFHAISWNAKMIFSVPCCQHELNKQFSASSLEILSRYGIVKERVAALMTDSIRANLLEYCGYKTQIMEFVDFENTPKNLLIRAVSKNSTGSFRKIDITNNRTNREKYLREVYELMEMFSFKPTLYKLLLDNGFILEEK